jgi:hypothetical protein
MCNKLVLNFDPIVLLKVTSILKALKEDINLPYSITQSISMGFLSFTEVTDSNVQFVANQKADT